VESTESPWLADCNPDGHATKDNSDAPANDIHRCTQSLPFSNAYSSDIWVPDPGVVPDDRGLLSPRARPGALFGCACHGSLGTHLIQSLELSEEGGRKPHVLGGGVGLFFNQQQHVPRKTR
jgi:hypothetical protein